MFTKYPDGSVSCSACVKAIDLIKIVNQIFNDNMQYVKVTVHFPTDDDGDEFVKISAIPSPTSDDVKEYPLIIGNSFIDIDDDC